MFGPHLRYQDGYCGCGGSQRYYFRRCAVKLHFIAPKFGLHPVKKKVKNEKLRFTKNIFLFLRVHELGIVLWVNTDQKKKTDRNRVGKVCSPKKMFDFLSPVKVRNF